MAGGGGGGGGGVGHCFSFPFVFSDQTSEREVKGEQCVSA